MIGTARTGRPTTTADPGASSQGDRHRFTERSGRYLGRSLVGHRDEHEWRFLPGEGATRFVGLRFHHRHDCGVVDEDSSVRGIVVGNDDVDVGSRPQKFGYTVVGESEWNRCGAGSTRAVCRDAHIGQWFALARGTDEPSADRLSRVGECACGAKIRRNLRHLNVGAGKGGAQREVSGRDERSKLRFFLARAWNCC